MTVTATTTFTKGDRCFYIGSYGSNSFYIQECIVTANGAKSIRLVDAFSGKPAHSFLHKYLAADTARRRIVKCDEATAREIALQLCAELIATNIAFNEAHLVRYPHVDPTYINERTAEMRAAVPSVEAPYAPGGKCHSTVQHVARKSTATKYVARYNGTIVGTRKSDRTYTHAVVGFVSGQPKAIAWCGRLDLAQKQLTDRYARWKASDLFIVAAEKA